MKRIDLDTWPRGAAYRHYRPYGAPHMAMTVEVDVSALRDRCRGEERSFFAGMMQALVGAANTVPALRQRFRVLSDGDELVEHRVVDPAFTVAVEGGVFNFATVAYTDDPVVFAERVGAVSEAKRGARELEPFDGVRDDVVYMSCLPWMTFSSLTHPVSSPEDCVPRIAWGRFQLHQGRAVLPVNIQVHHALVDGLHLGAFFAAVEAGVR